MGGAIIFIWLLFGLTCGVIASNKGRSGCGWCILGILLGPFAVLMIAFSPKIDESTEESPDTHVRCPECAELVLKQAIKCKHCGCALTPTN